MLDKEVYNDSNERVGRVDDMLIAPDTVVSYVIVEQPDLAANWQLRFQFRFLFPK